MKITTFKALERIKKNDIPQDENNKVLIKCAGNEYEGVHLNIYSENGDIRDIDISVSDLKNEKGIIFPKTNISIYREHYIKIDTLSSRSTAQLGWYPDALIPFINPVTGNPITIAKYLAYPFTLKVNENQPYYLEVYVPKNTPSGIYSGVVTISSKNAGTISLPFSLRVYGFNLPEKTLIRGNFGIGGARYNEIFSPAYSQRWIAVQKRFEEELIKHRIMPSRPYNTSIGYDTAGNINTTSAERWCKYFFDTLNVNSVTFGLWNDGPYSKQLTVNKAKTIRYIRNIFNFFKQNKWEHLLYTYMVDEPNQRDLFTVSCSDPQAYLTITDSTFEIRTSSGGAPDVYFNLNSAAFNTLNKIRDSLIKKNGYTVSNLLYYTPEGTNSRRSLIKVGNLDISNPLKPGIVIWTQYELVRQLSNLVHEAVPELKYMCTEQTLTSDTAWGNLFGAVNIWCPLFGYWDSTTAAQRSSQGDEMWIYTALCQPGPKKKDSPYWQIDYPLLNYRIPMWIMWQQKITGLLYWASTYWNQSIDPWLNPITYGIGSSNRYNGEGSLFYPGVDAGFDGPVASLRLKSIRDGIEDYMYFKMASELGILNQFNSILVKVAKNWFTWEKDTELLYALRDTLAFEIEKKIVNKVNLLLSTQNEITILPPHPNPFNSSINLNFSINRTIKEPVIIRIFDLLGKEVSTLLNKSLEPGFYSYPFEGKNISSGCYIYSLSCGKFIQYKSILLIK